MAADRQLRWDPIDREGLWSRNPDMGCPHLAAKQTAVDTEKGWDLHHLLAREGAHEDLVEGNSQHLGTEPYTSYLEVEWYFRMLSISGKIGSSD